MSSDPISRTTDQRCSHYQLIIDRLRAGRQTLIADYTCEVPATGLVLLLGENGVGKSLLLRALAKLDSRQSAAIRRIDGGTPETAVVFDFPGLLGTDGIAELVGKARWFDCDQTVLSLNLASLGIDPSDQRPFSRWSLGTRQRARIAVALSTLRPIVIMDEPFRSIDTDQRFALISLLVAVAESRLVLISTHHPELLAGFAQLALVLHQSPNSVDPRLVEPSQGARVHVAGSGIEAIAGSKSLRSGAIELQMATVGPERLRALHNSLGSSDAATSSFLVAPNYSDDPELEFE